MKICQLCTIDFTLYHFLLPLMRRMREEGHEVVGICAPGPLADRVAEEGFRIVPVPLRRSGNPLRNLRALAALTRLFRTEDFDLIHVHTPVAALIGRAAAAAARARRVVYTAHGFYFHEGMDPARRRLYQALEWIAGRGTATLFTQSEEDATTARRLGLCRSGDVLAIGNGSDPARFAPDFDGTARHNIRMTLGTPPDRSVVLMIGRMVAEKGYNELFDAMRHVDAELWVAGERLASDHAGDVEAKVEAIRVDPALADRFRFLGYRTDIPDLLRAADIFTLPSHREGMPRSIIEAMLTGLPVVATDVRGSREEVVDGETGLLVTVRDSDALAAALRQLTNDPDLRVRMGAAGLRRARALYDERLVLDRQIDHLGLRRSPSPQTATATP